MTATRISTFALLGVVAVTLLAAPAAAQEMTDDGMNSTETMSDGSMTTTESGMMTEGGMTTTESGMMTEDDSMDENMTDTMEGSMSDGETTMSDGSMSENMTDTMEGSMSDGETTMNDGSMSEETTMDGETMNEETTMNDATTTGSAETDAADSGTTSGSGPGFTVALALVALAGIGLLAARRRA